MKRQLQGISLILMAILLTLTYGNEAFFDLSMSWHTIFVLIGLAGGFMTFLPSQKDKHE